jgi:hypothetical protein
MRISPRCNIRQKATQCMLQGPWMVATFFYSGPSHLELFASQNLQPRMGFFSQSCASQHLQPWMGFCPPSSASQHWQPWIGFFNRSSASQSMLKVAQGSKFESGPREGEGGTEYRWDVSNSMLIHRIRWHGTEFDCAVSNSMLIHRIRWHNTEFDFAVLNSMMWYRIQYYSIEFDDTVLNSMLFDRIWWCCTELMLNHQIRC